MKLLKRILLTLLALILLACGGTYLFLQSSKPTYEGSLSLEGLQQEVKVYFDEYGIPHIYAENELDAQFALGYVHAQDRLFQMEMLRRLSRGELAEVLGPDLAKTDRFFRTIGVMESAKKAAKRFNAKPDTDPIKQGALAYYKGVNAFMEQGKTPLEFRILGIPKRPFTVEDTYAIYGYMAFSFAQAFRTDPMMQRILDKLGPEYLHELDIHWTPGAQTIPVWGRDNVDTLISQHFGIEQLFESMPVAPWIGSNSWVIGPDKTESGKVILSNDTHMGFAQPSVWYEAHIVTPELDFYGNYLGGVPFSVMGHNRHHAIGITMLENDDIDFYVEKINPANSNQVEFRGEWEGLRKRNETIKVKGEEDLSFEVLETPHGPIINEAIDHIAAMTQDPVSMYWVFNEFPIRSLESSYYMARAKTMEECRAAVAMGHAPGLNVMYGDIEGNIAWYAMAKLPRRPDHVNSKLLLDGASGEDEILGYFAFEDNPQSENPEVGYLYSANNQPDSSGGYFHQGYYIPEDRAKRIVEVLEEREKWDLKAAKDFILDTKSPISPKVIAALADQIKLDQMSDNENAALIALKAWDGSHELERVEPTIYFKWLYHLLEKTFADELGEEDFNAFLSTHVFKRTYPFLFEKEASPWWDDQSTTDKTESRSEIASAAFRQTIKELEAQLGSDIAKWHWEKVHQVEHPHALGQVPALARIFNVGPIPINGGMEVINNLNFKLNGDGYYKVNAGPAKRRIVDFSDLDHTVSVLPTGQSGNLMSPHYNDQAQLFADGRFRLQKMNTEEIQGEGSRLLVLKP